MRVGKQFFLVQVNKAARLAKQDKTDFGLYLSPKYIDMRYNMQFGTIMDIGAHAQDNYPGAATGDILVFKHIVESQKWRLINRVPNEETGIDDEHLLVDITSGTEVYGVLKPTGEWLINKNYVFLNKDFKLIKNSEFSSFLERPDPEIFLDDSYVMQQIETLKNDLENMKESAESADDPDAFESRYAAMQSMADEQAKLGKFMHSKKFCKAQVAFVNDEVKQETGIVPACYIIVDHKLLYDLPLQGLGLHFKVAHTKFINAIYE